MYTKEDFEEAIKNAFLERELTAALYHAGDPRIMQTLKAQATMLAMISQQIEVAMMEPFVKSRNATVLADAALKGLIFTAKPCTIKVEVTNQGQNSVRIASGRNVIDSVGRYYKILEPVTIASGQIGYLICRQEFTEVQTHTVSNSHPFYAVEVNESLDGSYISSLSVKVNNELYSSSYKFNGVSAGDKVFHVDSDEFQRLYVKFGAEGIIGKQPLDGETITIEKNLTFGNISPDFGSPFSLQYIQSADENDLKMEMFSLEVSGTQPADIATLAELTRYPSIYDENAVFLGEFDMLLRSKFSNLSFLKVWNEQAEEKARGANVNNVNTLFVAFALPNTSSLTLSNVKAQITEVLNRADNSYKVKFVDPIIEKITVTINASISRAFDSGRVSKQIRDLLLQHYGQNAFVSKQGKTSVKNKEVADLIERNIQAIADRRGDYSVIVTNPINRNPEVFRYMDNSSIRLNINYDNYDSDSWNGS